MIGIVLRRLAGERAATLGLIVLVFVSAFLFSVAPRLLERSANETLRTEVGAAPSAERDLRVTEVATTLADPPQDNVEIEAIGERLQTEFPPLVQSLIGERTSVVETPAWQVAAGAAVNLELTVRCHARAFDHLRFVDGVAPTSRADFIPDPRGIVLAERVAVFEAAMADTVAKQVGAHVGSVLLLLPSASDSEMTGRRAVIALRITGTYEAIDAAEPFWTNDSALFEGRLNPFSASGDVVEATVMLAPETYGALRLAVHDAGVALHFEWRYAVDAAAVDGRLATETIADLRRLEAAPPRSGQSPVLSDTSLRSGLLRMLEAHQVRWLSAATILGIVGIGTAAVAAAALLALVTLTSTGRRRMAAALRMRGASTGQLLALALAEGALIVSPAALGGAALAIAAVPEASPTAAAVAALGVAMTGILIVVATMARGQSAERTVTAVARVSGRPSLRRLVVEASLVVLAVIATVLIRDRGLAAGSLDAADPLVATAPALVGLAASVILLRLYPLPTAVLAALAALRRGFVSVLALRRAVRTRDAAPVMLVLVAAASVGTFSAGVLAALDRGIRDAAWRDVGADYRIDNGFRPLPEGFAADLPGVADIAFATQRQIDTGAGRATLLVIDAQAFGRVSAGSPDAPILPDDLLGPAPAADGRLAALVATGYGPAVGGSLSVTIAYGQPRELEVVGQRRSFPGIRAAQPFIIVAREQLTTSEANSVGQPTVAYVASAAPPAEFHGHLETLLPSAVVDSRQVILASRLASTAVTAVSLGATTGVLATLGYTGLAVIAGLLLTGSVRRYELSVLRSLGLTASQQARALFVEFVPLAVISSLAGVAVGLGLYTFLAPTLGLRAIGGGSLEVGLILEPVHILLLLGAIGAILLIGWAAGIVAARDRDTVGYMRRSAE